MAASSRVLAGACFPPMKRPAFWTARRLDVPGERGGESGRWRRAEPSGDPVSGYVPSRPWGQSASSGNSSRACGFGGQTRSMWSPRFAGGPTGLALKFASGVPDTVTLWRSSRAPLPPKRMRTLGCLIRLFGHARNLRLVAQRRLALERRGQAVRRVGLPRGRQATDAFAELRLRAIEPYAH